MDIASPLTVTIIIVLAAPVGLSGCPFDSVLDLNIINTCQAFL